jgi:hypothetical protein
MAAQPVADVAEGTTSERRAPEIDPTVPWRGAVIVAGFALFPFVTFLAANRQEGLRPGQVAPYAGVAVGIGLILIVLAWATRGPLTADRVGVTVAGLWFVTVNYGPVSGAVESLGLSDGYQLLCWALLFVVAGIVTWRASRRLALRVWFLTMGILITAIPIAQLAQHRLAVSEFEPATAEALGVGLERTPNIYYVVPDAYGRADRLETMARFDNSGFLRSLEARGFVVAEDAYANYPTTFLSVAAVLAMDYVVEPGPEALAFREDGHNFDRSVFYDIIQGESTLVKTLREAGYRHVQAPPGTWGGSECSGNEELCVEPISEFGTGVVLGEVEWALLQLTPVATVMEGLGATFDDVTSDPVHTVEEIERQGWDDPVFAVIHMLHPHPPFRFDADCSALEAGERDLESWGDVEENGDAWVAGIQCTNRRLEAMLDVTPRDAVVVIQADHGSNFLRPTATSVDEWSDEQIEDRLAVLSAVRLPEDCRDMVDDRFAGVNTFRVVLACLSGEEPDLLPDRYMLARYRGENEVREIELPSAG